MTGGAERSVRDQLETILTDRVVTDLFTATRIYAAGTFLTFEDCDEPDGPIVLVAPAGDRYEVDIEIFVRSLPTGDALTPAPKD